jgi:hypothetical protein
MFCRIYVNGKKINKQFLLFELCDLLNTTPINNAYIETDQYSLGIERNDEWDKSKQVQYPDGFLYFPLSIGIDFSNEDEAAASLIVGKMLILLWKNGYSAIASCSFEHLLPEKGGYKSKNIPWLLV